MSDLKPTAAGALATTPFPNLLAYLLDRRLTGTLVVEDTAGQRSALVLERGYPTKARTADPVELIGQVLAELDLLDRAEAERAAELAAKARQLYGGYLVAHDLLTRESLESGLREQLRRRIRWMMSLPAEAIYGFYENVDLLEHWGGEGTPVESLALVWYGIRRYGQDDRVEATLNRLGEGTLKLHIDAQLAKFQFDRREQGLADVLLAKPQSLKSLVATRLLEEAVVRRMAYMLAITRHLDLGAGARPIGADEARTRQPVVGAASPAEPGSPVPVAGSVPEVPVEEASEVRSQKEEIRKRAAEVAEQDYYQVLGLDRRASADAAQAAFFQLAKKWHPDRLGAELGEVRELVTRTFARMSEAHATLTDVDKRQDYDRELSEPGGNDEEEQVARVLRAANAYQRAEILLKRQSFEAAEREAKVAMEGDPDQSDHLALYAWIVANKPERAEQRRYDDLIALFNRAVELGPMNERARFWRGQVLKRAGREEEAIKDFRWVSQNNPRHVDAARELRLFDMRRPDKSEKSEKTHDRPSTPPRARAPSSPGSGGKGGILSKLFRR